MGRLVTFPVSEVLCLPGGRPVEENQKKREVSLHRHRALLINNGNPGCLYNYRSSKEPPTAPLLCSCEVFVLKKFCSCDSHTNC